MKIRLILLLLIVASCHGPDFDEQLANMAGYWEIVEVVMEDGSIRDFSVNTTVDFIEISREEGLRKKLSLKPDGGFIGNDSAERFTWKIEDDSLRLYYQTPYATWKETVVSSTKTNLEVINSEGKLYKYKRFTPIDITIE